MVDETKPLSSGEILAMQMRDALVASNKIAQDTALLLSDIRELLAEDLKLRKESNILMDEMAGNHDVLLGAVDILGDISSNGKAPSMKDLIHALKASSEAVWGDGDEDEDEEDGGDEDGGGDDAGGRIRRRRAGG